MIKDLGRIVGLSAYEVAVQNGYTGTEAEWLESLIGNSAYEEAVKNGFDGTFAEWVETLKVKVTNLEKSVSGNTNTVTLTFNDGSTYSFTVENGKEISSITKTASTATDSTLLVAYNDGTSETVTIPNGTGISSVEKIGTNVLEDTYRINYTDKEPSTFTVKNGRSIVSIVKSSSNGIVDTYTITYNDQTASTFTVVNSIDTIPYQYTDADGIDGSIYTAGRENIGTVAPAAGTQIDKYMFRWATAATYICFRIPVRAGQMFRVTASASQYNPLLTVIGANNIINDVNLGGSSYKLTNHLVEVQEDGYLLINVKKDSTYSIKRVTIFTETEAAIAAIPSTQTLVDRVVAALPLAEGGAF